MVWYGINGKEKFKSLHTDNIREARKKLRNLLSEIDKEKDNILDCGEDIYISKLLDEYISYRFQRRPKSTVDLDRYSLNKFIEYNGNIKTKEVKSLLIDDMIANMKSEYSRSTVNLCMKHLKSCFNWALKRGYLSHNPFTGIELLTVTAAERARALTTEQIARLFEHICGDAMEDVIKFLIWTGCRRNEALSLQGRDVSFNRDIIFIRARNTKSKQNREIPFSTHEGLKELLQNHRVEPQEFVFKSTKK
ncbi:MAG: tyrosine-type recombinase/integrase [Candidatus Electryonea clarkiae]|nr:tyrosine-type recombinase/integrase [Candidatus Electryonea clarkiae]MDP8285877.1 tyrosine-type recombinase/integrase [Candidatus Electryonea clarkiae]